MGMLVFPTRKWAAFRDLGQGYVFFDLCILTLYKVYKVTMMKGMKDEKEELEPCGYNVD